MAYRYRRSGARRRTYRSSNRRSNYQARGYTGRRTYRRTGRRRTVTPKVVIQVIGGSGGVPVSAQVLGKKMYRPVRARY